MTRSVRDPLRGVRLLLVENDGDLRAALADLLARKGCLVREAASVGQAAALLAAETFDIVVSDYELGAETTSAMFESAPQGLPLVCLTGHLRPVLPANVWVLRKPVEIDALLGAICKSVAREAPLDSPSPAVRIRVALYLDSRSPMGTRARRRFYETLERFSPDGAEVIEVDVRAGPPPEGVPQPTFLPSVCRLEPTPRVWLVGDLTEIEPLEALLESGGVVKIDGGRRS